ncbi:hypothetical protein Tco_1176019 [Tanacetum coccineum]
MDLFGGGVTTLVSRAKVIENQVMAISIILVSSDSSKDSVGTPAGRVILFDSDIPYTPPSPTHDTPFTENTLSTQRSPIALGALRRRVMILAPGQPIPYGRLYRYHPNRPVHMMTVRKRIGPLPTHRIVDSSTDALSDSASSRSSFDHSLPVSPSASRRPESATDLEGCSEDSFEPYVPRDVRLGVDFEDESSEPSRSRGTDLEMDVDAVRSDRIEIDPETQAEINECFAYADALRDRGIDARVVVEAIDREEIETGMRGPVEVRMDRATHPVIADDILEPAQEGAVERDQGHKIVAIGHQSADMLERIQELERDYRRLRDIMDVESLRLAPGSIWVTVLRLLHGYPSIDSTMPNTRSGASSTRKGVNEQSDCRMAEALRVRDTVRNLRPLMGDEGEQGEVNGNGGNGDGGNGNRGNGNRGNGNGVNENRGNGNGGNGNGNGNGGEYGYNFRGFMPAREFTYQDFLKCQPLNFNGTEGVIGLTRCALTFGVELPQLRTVGIEGRPMPMILKMETELWNLAVKGYDLTAYTRRFQELVLLCTRMVPSEEDKVERFGGGLPDNIQGNVIAADPTQLQDAIRIANNLMD